VTPIDFRALADALLQRIDSLLPRWLPNGIERNGRWYVGDFDGSTGESANVNMVTGQWIDNAAPDSEKGGDLLSLYRRLHGHSTMLEAARAVMAEMGWADRDDDDTSRQAPPQASAQPTPDQAEGDAAPWPDDVPAPDAPRPRRKREPKWRAMHRVPGHAPYPKFIFSYKDTKAGAWVELSPTYIWEYSYEGQLYGYTARFERVDSRGQLVKDVVARTWCENLEDGGGGQRWHWKSWEAPRPLYVPATLLSENGGLPVVVVEGEKCAQAGHQLLGHEFDFVSWPGGGKAWAMADWAWLKARHVVLWPDVDAKRHRLTKDEELAGVKPEAKPLQPAHKQPGMVAMAHIGTLLQAEHGCSVSICRVPAPGDVPDGWDIADAIAEGWDAERVRAFLRAAVEFVPPSDEARAKVAAAESTPSTAGAAPGEGGAGWRGALLQSATGSIKAARENVVLALDGMRLKDGGWLPGIPEAQGVIAFNDFTNDVIKLKPTPWGTAAGVWGEEDELEMGLWLTHAHWLPPMSRQTLEEAVSMVARRHRYHPARERFLALQGKWDGEKRTRHWLQRTCRPGDSGPADTPQNRYLARVGTWVLMAICQRVLQPGCKFDYMLILEGGQGLGKSTLARILGGDWFADTGLVLGDKDSYQNLQGVLVYEWGELDSLTRSEVTKVKQFISSQKDRFRASFDRRPKDYPRQVVFIGTTNESHYLSDPTGNRRFWPVRVLQQIDLDWLRANAEQLFAEAMHYLQAGERFHPTPVEQRELFDPQQLERTVENALESAIRRYLYDEDQRISLHGLNGSLIDEITLAELLNALNISVDKQTQVLTKQASAVLGRLGWERGRGSPTLRGSEKVRPWVYRRPKATASSTTGLQPGAVPGGSGVQPPTPGQDDGGPDGCPF
jgi:putative DNA primase/helicase